jgi:hypothetical protein
MLAQDPELGFRQFFPPLLFAFFCFGILLFHRDRVYRLSPAFSMTPDSIRRIRVAHSCAKSSS